MILQDPHASTRTLHTYLQGLEKAKGDEFIKLLLEALTPSVHSPGSMPNHEMSSRERRVTWTAGIA